MEYVALCLAIVTTIFVASHFNMIETIGKFCFITIILATFSYAFDQIFAMKVFAVVCMLVICCEMKRTGEYRTKQEAKDTDEINEE